MMRASVGSQFKPEIAGGLKIRLQQHQNPAILHAGFRSISSISCSSGRDLSLSAATTGSIEPSVQESAQMRESTNGSALKALEPAFGILYYENFSIRCYEVGSNRRASIQTIANLLQEVACNQVRTLGFSTDGFATSLSMRKHHLIWVTTRMHIEMEEYPSWGDIVQIYTWFMEDRFGTRRDWLLKDLNTGKILGRATSTWVMMNQHTRRLVKMVGEIKEECLQYVLNPPRYSFLQDHPTYSKQSIPIPKVESPENRVLGLKAMRADLDMNQHVNNVTYIGWMLESLPASLENTHDLQCIILQFKRECKHEDTVDSMVAPCDQAMCGDEQGDQKFAHVVTLAGSSAEINLGLTRWRPKK